MLGNGMKASVAKRFCGCVTLIAVCHKHSAALKKKANERADVLKALIPIVGEKKPVFLFCLKTMRYDSCWNLSNSIIEVFVIHDRF